MQQFRASLSEMVVSLWRNRALVALLVKRDVVGRYRGSLFGILWSFFHPVFMLIIYTFVFSIVLGARWNEGSDSKVEFALVLFAGLMVFNLFAEVLNRAPNLIVSNVNYVKKVVFPLEILPWVTIGAALFHTLVSFSVWVIFHAIFFGAPHLTLFLFPLVLLPVVLLVAGVSWLVASLGVYLRDVGQVVGVVTTALLFLSSIFYPITALPESYRTVLYLNPLVSLVEQARDSLMWGNIPSVRAWLVLLSVGVATAWLGFAWFQKTRKGFADVL